MITFDAFRQCCLDLTPLGLQDDPSFKKSVIIPANAKVLAWLVDSPIYFCQIPEHGETVFVVNPMGFPEEQILPVAEDIAGFIRLLIYCKDASLIAGAYQWSQFRFREQIETIELSMKSQSVLRALENIYHPPMIQNPASYMLQLRKSFTATLEPEHFVGFHLDYSQNCSQEEAGEELVLNRQAAGENGCWNVPSVFLCNEGIVVETYLEVSASKLEDFLSLWGNRNETSLSIGDKMQRYLDNPLTAAFNPILSINDKPLRCKNTISAVWNPLLDNPGHIRRLLNHYHLDPDQGYLFMRYCFPRKGKYPKIRTMELILEAIPVMVPDESFTVNRDGQRFRITHPTTGLDHIFTAVSLTQEALNPNFLTNHPCFYSRLVYTLEPSISPENFRIVDLSPSDYWKDYQDEPAAVIFADQKPDPGRYALSSLHYEPQNNVHWQIMFRKKLHQDLKINLLP